MLGMTEEELKRQKGEGDRGGGRKTYWAGTGNAAQSHRLL